MKIRATLLSIAKLAAFTAAAGACAHPQNKVLTDTPVLPYQAPDIAEITGIEEPDTDTEEAEQPAPEHHEAPAPAPAPEKKEAPPPATPAKAPPAPAKTPAPAKQPAPAKTPAPAKAPDKK